ncbi:MAG: aminopeptidase N, partial [Thiovulaceae bacterium]|nr:aminopeptidase N [Sulfurimonadaceae bacterium]
MSETDVETIYLEDYEKPPFLVEKNALTFVLDDSKTHVTNVMQIKRNARDADAMPLVLSGENMVLDKVILDGVELHATQYELSTHSLTLHNLPHTFELEIQNIINPIENKALDGLYKSGGIFCTQNEPEGFRRITYYIDRPDVMALFETKIIARKSESPVLLSNGNLIDSGDLDDGYHYATWDDPYPKPSYLYALVAGDLGVVEDHYVTTSGRDVALKIYCDPGNEEKCQHAMSSLKSSMQWDEQRFDREYDLGIYMIVAVDSFNMGAMENKGLNIFNSHYVLANQETATDNDFLGIESVIGHEYFHNWTGNRITCRDWFQLTLKEGLTVYRDQEFSADLNDRSVQRISDVGMLRMRQFVEDASPTAHPIKPKEYIQINNFYTATVYEKGAEVIRMLDTLLGRDGFKKGMDLYFKTFDGQAITTEDFLWSMSEANGQDLSQFSLWYDQQGTPVVDVTTVYDAKAKSMQLTFRQSNFGKEALLIPQKIALLDDHGKAYALSLTKPSSKQPLLEKGIIVLTKEEESFVFENIHSEPFLSLNRFFSAPIKMHIKQKEGSLAFLMAHDEDDFNRFEASQVFALEVLQELLSL